MLKEGEGYLSDFNIKNISLSSKMYIKGSSEVELLESVKIIGTVIILNKLCCSSLNLFNKYDVPDKVRSPNHRTVATYVAS